MQHPSPHLHCSSIFATLCYRNLQYYEFFYKGYPKEDKKAMKTLRAADVCRTLQVDITAAESHLLYESGVYTISSCFFSFFPLVGTPVLNNQLQKMVNKFDCRSLKFVKIKIQFDNMVSYSIVFPS